jgi:hypothetical protein
LFPDGSVLGVPVRTWLGADQIVAVNQARRVGLVDLYVEVEVLMDVTQRRQELGQGRCEVELEIVVEPGRLEAGLDRGAIEVARSDPGLDALCLTQQDRIERRAQSPKLVGAIAQRSEPSPPPPACP